MTAVRGRRVLIVEDEYLLAQDLSRHFARMGAEVLGPVSNVEAAELQVHFAEAAVLDIDLDGRKVFPVADALARRQVPFVFYSGRGDIAIPARFRHAGRLSKPSDVSAVFDALFPERSGISVRDASPDDVLAILPKLRLSALLLMERSGPADRLVELTLEHALATVHTRGDDMDLEDWLTGLLEQTHRRFGRDLLL
jgi:ActR/RegA family two-component response regulator